MNFYVKHVITVVLIVLVIIPSTNIEDGTYGKVQSTVTV